MLLVAEWLQEFLNESLSVPQLSDALEAAGVEIEDVKHPPEFDDKLVVVAVKSVKRHPNADRLKMVEVDDGDQTLSIVCGATNVEKGQHVVLAHVGAKLPGGQEIERAEIRGETSQGMLCSEQELGLGNHHDGILVLGSEAKVGMPLHEIYHERYSVIDIKTAANRPDLQSYVGLAREVAAHTDTQLVSDDGRQLSIKAAKSDNLFSNQIKEQVACYGLVKLKIDGQRQAPDWMQQRLRLSGIKTINAVVDITNYCMLEYGQPLHAFDAAEVEGAIEIRFAGDDESLTTLDGVKRTLSKQDIVIADKARAVGLAGIMGGESSEISGKTKEILLEAATFDAELIRKSARRHSLRTEASARFERGLPVQTVKQALKYATQLLIEHAGAEVVSYQHELNIWPWVQHIGVRASYLKTMSGLDLEREKIATELRKLDFDANVFDIVAETKKHLGKPYKWGASFKTDGVEAFDCSYLIDYIYSLIGVRVGHTALGQYELGSPVEDDDLRAGDVVFYNGKIENSAIDHYYTSEDNQAHVKHELSSSRAVGHNGIYIGEGKVVMAAKYEFKKGDWVERSNPGVIEVPLEEFTGNSGYLGARRYVDNLNDYVAVTVPWWRPDVKLEADVVEEVVKLIGLDEISTTLPVWRPTRPQPDSYWPRWQEIRCLLKGQGLFEVNTYPFISPDDIELFQLTLEHWKLQNPRSQEQAYLRTALTPQLLRSAAANVPYPGPFALFEMARVFLPASDKELPLESERLSVVTLEEEPMLHAKGLLDRVFELAHIKSEYVSSEAVPWLHPSRQATVKIGDRIVGHYGLLHPDIARQLKLPAAACLEVEIEPLLEHWSPPDYKPLSKFQSGYRDLTVHLPHHVSWQEVTEALSDIEGVLVSFRDEYVRQQDKALTMHLEMSADKQTLTDQDIEARQQQVVARLQQRFGAKL